MFDRKSYLEKFVNSVTQYKPPIESRVSELMQESFNMGNIFVRDLKRISVLKKQDMIKKMIFLLQ